ncbi:lysoplasmalogenase [Croceicoccus hydrothermalis]|uniref:lysoplasmalogenase n=1 Tax=Croceicoccus hydrothermalis TaxID=2867964 RepID=UPI001EFB8993|nr:lysoplasmalogenase [Croceicoccus hydrothermalis]
MVKRALIERRPWLLLSLFFGVSWWFVAGGAVPGLYQIAWKGAAVGALAIYAFQRHLGRDGALIAGVMTLYALADMAQELWLAAGGVLHAIGHLLAIWLFARNRRVNPARSQRLVGIALAIGVPLDAYLLAFGGEGRWMVAGYALILGAMAAMAWQSRFSRYRIGAGAVLFVLSDLLLIAVNGPLRSVAVAGSLVWPLYYTGVLMICTGVVVRLRRERG